MLNSINTFINDESGAVTVDWVVLTAALVGLGLAVMSVVSGGIQNLSGDIGQTLANQAPGADAFNGNATFTANSSTYTVGTAPSHGSNN
ncbi:Flp family type IVb pilin [Jannaschia marina]|uniref:Flp family type IVb pilin n=1 Tax=Jannaschia marina TaxID=2741674 RepID=UPI0015C75DEE|nr:hypothetical protein [Jannaschia marina]